MLASICPYPAVELSVILPALRPDSDYLRCIYSLRAALAGTMPFEIISVVREVEAFSELASSDLRIVPERGTGIYAAMNTGLDYANGIYVYFIGQDDIFLPEAVNALNFGFRLNADVILGDVFWGKCKIFRNSRSPHSLVWKNWCHQGIIYRREIFDKCGLRFPEDFKVQADHYVNIVLATRRDLTIVKYDTCIAWYSSGGFSTTNRDSTFRTRFPSIVRENFGLLSFFVVVLRRALLRATMKVFRR
ncbi:MAG: glycosyltransferase [Nitrososphaerota archaeon]|nr:glycosyltransferase [Nitrososphaerota archaeon]